MQSCCNISHKSSTFSFISFIEAIIEVKPTKDLRPPVGGKGKKRSTVLYEAKTYQMNRDKFASARKWCDERNITFDIWTEKHLRQKG